MLFYPQQNRTWALKTWKLTSLSKSGTGIQVFKGIMSVVSLDMLTDFIPVWHSTRLEFSLTEEYSIQKASKLIFGSKWLFY